MKKKSFFPVVIGFVLVTLQISIFSVHAQTFNIPDGLVTIAADGQCSLHEAIINADDNAQTHADCPAGNGDDVIELANGGTYTYTTAQSRTIDNTADSLTINGNNATIDLNNQSSFLIVETGADVILNDISIINGSGLFAGAIRNAGSLEINRSVFDNNRSSGGNGGAIDNSFILEITDSTFSNNQTWDSTLDVSGGALYHHPTGSLGYFRILNSTFSGNIAESTSGTTYGGAIHSNSLSSSTSEIRNSTFSGNIAHHGAAINVQDGRLSIYSSTITANLTSTVSSETTKTGGGLRQVTDTVQIQNTIISENYAGNDATEDCEGTIDSLGYNMVGLNSNAEGCPTDGYADIVPDEWAGLMPLADNGGPTQTHALVPGSLALNSGFCFGVTTDQRGLSRPVGICDRGAFEARAVPVTSTYVVDTTLDYEVDSTDIPAIEQACTSAPNDCNLRQAILKANLNPNPLEYPVVISIPAGTYTMTVPNDDANRDGTGDYDIENSMTIQGAGADQTIIDANGIDRIFQTNIGIIFPVLSINESILTISDMTITGGNLNGLGAGIRASGPLTILNSIITGNTVAGFGGGIIAFDELTVENSIINNNTADTGGAIAFQGSAETLSINNSVISGNTATNGEGGGLWLFGGNTVITNSQITSNKSLTNDGGGIYVYSGGAINVSYTTISDNVAELSGGGISLNSGSLTTLNSTIANNTANTGDGGGIYAPFRFVNLNNTTIVNNHADSGSGGGVYHEDSEFISADLIFNSTIVTGNSASTNADCHEVFEGSLFSVGYNLFGQNGDASDCPANGSTDIVLSSTADTAVKPLGDYGGSMQTVLPVSTGPAINAGNCSSFVDQRGFPRVQGAICDIGSVEQQPPVAAHDDYDASTSVPLAVDAPGVISNDTDPDEDTLMAVLVNDAANGTVTLNEDGSFTYEADAGFKGGNDTFTYSASDGTLTSPPVTVTITVTNSPPVALADMYIIRQGEVVKTDADTGVLNNDSDPDDDPLTAELVSIPVNGSLTFLPDGSFTYTPSSTFLGSDVFTYRADDGINESDSVTVTITTEPGPGYMFVEGDLNNAPIRPSLVWIPVEDDEGNLTPKDWYEVFFWHDESQTHLFWLWFPKEDICEGERCTLPLGKDLVPASLVNGTYRWWIRWYDSEAGSFSEYSNEANFVINVDFPTAPNGFTVTGNHGKPSLSIPNDPGAAWYHVYLGQQNAPAESPPYQHNRWYEKDKLLCDETRCLLNLEADPPNGDYDVYVQSWGPGGYNDEDDTAWAGPQDFALGFEPPQAVTGMTATATADQIVFTWNGAAGSTWYALWAGTSDYDETLHYQWHPAQDLGCPDAELCGITITDVALTVNTTYTWFVRSWGPGGFNIGGLEGGSGWVEGPHYQP